MPARKKRVQVGWYCDHRDEKKVPPYAGSHMSAHGKWRKKKGWLETYPAPDTTQAITFLNHHDPKKPPHCPLAVPTYIYISAEEEN